MKTQNENNVELTQLLAAIDNKIIKIDKDAIKSNDSYKTTFLEGKSAGLNDAYTMIKAKFNLP